jgi:hypothetical protein
MAAYASGVTLPPHELLRLKTARHMESFHKELSSAMQALNSQMVSSAAQLSSAPGPSFQFGALPTLLVVNFYACFWQVVVNAMEKFDMYSLRHPFIAHISFTGGACCFKFDERLEKWPACQQRRAGGSFEAWTLICAGGEVGPPMSPPQARQHRTDVLKRRRDPEAISEGVAAEARAARPRAGVGARAAKARVCSYCGDNVDFAHSQAKGCPNYCQAHKLLKAICNICAPNGLCG